MRALAGLVDSSVHVGMSFGSGGTVARKSFSAACPLKQIN